MLNTDSRHLTEELSVENASEMLKFCSKMYFLWETGLQHLLLMYTGVHKDLVAESSFFFVIYKTQLHFYMKCIPIKQMVGDRISA